MTQTTITAGDASAGLVQSAGNDGTMVLQTGPAGSKVNALSFAADGTPTLLKTPAITNPNTVSMVRLNTANGYGSTNIFIPRFLNITQSQGTDITYTDSATLGASLTINVNGVYAISYSRAANAASNIGLSKNTTQGTLAINAINTADILTFSTASAASVQATVAVTAYFVAGDVIRPHTDGSASLTYISLLTITRVA